MKTDKLLEIKKLPLKDRIIGDEHTKQYWVDYIDKTKDDIDYVRMIHNMSKSDFYNGHFLYGDKIAKTYQECPGMFLANNSIDGCILVIPLMYLMFTKIDRLPNDEETLRLLEYLSWNFNIKLWNYDLKKYKTDLDSTYKNSEMANYDWVDDWEFYKDKLERIDLLRNENCKTYDDYNRICGG